MTTTVGGEPLYEADYQMQVRTQVYKTQLQEYTIRKKALDELINQKLLEAEAARLGVNPNALLEREADSKIKPPTDEEVEENFVRMMFRGGGNVTKEHIREQLLQQILGEARDAYFQKLRAKAGVTVLLAPPRMPVEYDPQRTRGVPAAKITMIEFTDFRCPFCLQAVLQQVIRHRQVLFLIRLHSLILRQSLLRKRTSTGWWWIEQTATASTLRHTTAPS